MNDRRLLVWLTAGLLFLAACNGNGAVSESLPATATLAPIVSLTPRFTATPVPTRTPLPTATYTPSVTPIPPTPSDTPTPTEIPPIIGIIASMQSVNVREGPGVNFSAIEALRPGTGVEVLGVNNDGTWYNIRMDSGSEGWIAATLVRLQDTPTPFPTLTPSPDLTALALGTTLPTAILGGGTITPTPPPAAITPTPVTVIPGEAAAAAPTGQPGLQLPNMEAIGQTATALAAGGISLPTIEPTSGVGGPAAGPILNATPTSAPAQSGSTTVGAGVDVLAYCDDRSRGVPAPTNLLAGSTIDIFWSWYARSEQQVRDHISAATYEIRLDGVLLTNWRSGLTSIRQQDDGNYWVYWFLPAGPLTAGEHRITYSVSWSSQISDGYDTFGPGTRYSSQSGSCTFTVR